MSESPIKSQCWAFQGTAQSLVEGFRDGRRLFPEVFLSSRVKAPGFDSSNWDSGLGFRVLGSVV